MVYIKLFKTEQERQACTDTYEYVSYTEESDKVNIHYEQFFCKLTLNNGEVIEIEGSGELTSAMTIQYSATTVSAEIGSLCTSIGDFAFCDAENYFGFGLLTTVNIPNSVTSIGNGAFGYCSSLTSINIPDSVTSIGNGAFSRCSGLTSINIPDSVTSIGNSAFSRCSGLTSINIPDSVTSIGMAVFSSCIALTSVTIGNSVTSIRDSAFISCSGLTSITIPDSVTSIENYAFKKCLGLTSVTIGNSVTSIGQSAFEGCSGLTSITIPDSVTSIGSSAFYNCSGLTSITSLATTAPTIKNNTFRNVKTDGKLYVPSGSSGYDTWMQNANYYLGLYGWTKVEQ